MINRAAESYRQDGMRRAYLLGPSHGTPAERVARFRPAFDALTSAGFAVTAPAVSQPAACESADHLLSVMDDDLDALAAADVVVTLPGSDRLWEIAIADALGVPVVSFADCLAERACA
ncbi:hypothetical protein DER29_0509 [Micromonospora sp. M71_S20]|uniref:DUF4406 domain-containing protein n=1 Tax=Micromonospora sp. M71_S20 TaxID=592872 RepID=UPI000EB4D51A|nr:DUF4406 domain-containing protein [Micromonospora sp. M71_S20]RLK22670.1 hypothetical protein DER29_0509 [Micromonospora sp. M71_S20]